MTHHKSHPHRLDPSVEQLDLLSIRWAPQLQNLNWAESVLEYRRFLSLKKSYPSQLFIPSGAALQGKRLVNSSCTPPSAIKPEGGLFFKRYKCPNNIHTPTAMSVSPPKTSALCPNTEPIVRPNITPSVTMNVVANPIRAAAIKMFTLINASPTPTAIASMLVPIAVRETLRKE